jgi:uncharacterized protein YgiM (DUF1202 family)
MNKLWAFLSIILLTLIVLYWAILISNDNKCSWVRIFDCQKKEAKINEKLILVNNEIYNKIKPTGDVFINDCKPVISEWKEIYLLDYSKCNLKVKISKTKDWVEEVNVEWKKLTRKEINANFWNYVDNILFKSK